MHDKRPALIARCLSNEDVAHAVTFARERNLLTAIRGGGHSWPGKSICDDGLMIDLSQMHNVEVDAETQRAIVGGGALLGHLDAGGSATWAGYDSWRRIAYRRRRLHTRRRLWAPESQVRPDNRQPYRRRSRYSRWQIRRQAPTKNPICSGPSAAAAATSVLSPSSSSSCIRSTAMCCPAASSGQSRRRVTCSSSTRSGGRLSDEMYVGPTMRRRLTGVRVIMMDVVYNGDPAAGEKELAPLRAIGTPIVDGVMSRTTQSCRTMNDAASATAFAPTPRTAWSRSGPRAWSTPWSST